ncbi:MAG: hypothetical protein QW101_05030 [Ignisphaera sp.]
MLPVDEIYGKLKVELDHYRSVYTMYASNNLLNMNDVLKAVRMYENTTVKTLNEVGVSSSTPLYVTWVESKKVRDSSGVLQR